MHNLKEQPVWVNWKLINNKKRPFSAITGHETGTSPEHAGEWTDYSKAVEKLKPVNNGNTDRTKCIKHTKNGVDGIDGSCGVGFIVPEGYFFLDVDHQKKDSLVVLELMSALPTYAEVSPSGNGVHFYGKCDLSKLPIDIMDSQNWDGKNRGTQKKLSKDYYTKNPHNGIELYIGGLTNRFSTFTGDCISETEKLIDCTEGLLTILENKMKKYPQGTQGEQEAQGIQEVQCPPCPQGCDDGAEFVQLGEDDIPQIISDLRKQKNGSKFISLFDEGEIPDKKTQSEADISLCAMIAFRTGPDPDLINSIFRQSALYRPKWDREDYATRTIEAGIEACHGNFHPAVKKEPDLPPFVIMKKGKPRVSIPKLEAYVNTNLPYIIVRDSAGTDSNIYVYRNGVYNRYAREVFAGAIKAFIEKYDPNLVDVAVLDKTVASICKSENYVNVEFLNTDEQYINLQNGLLDINTMTLLPHDPKVYSTVQLPLVYNPAHPAHIDTPVFDSYLDTLTDGVADKKQFLLEFLGACLSNVPGFHMKKALFLYGPGDTGKSILKRLTERLLGVGNYTGIDLSQMEARFGSSSIYGKRLSGSADMSFMTISELKIFKKATGGDVIRAEFKGKDGFEFTYKGLLWFCMNKLPKFGGDDGQWVYDRIIPVHCPNVIPVSKRDPELLDKMFQERDGIFNKAVRAFKTVIENDYTFHEPVEAIEMRRQYRIDNNTALEFFNTMMKKRTGEIGRNDDSTIDAIYKAYVDWYFEQSYKSNYRKNRKEFFNDIADFLGEEYETMKKRVHSGVCLKDYVLKKNAPVPLVG